jgi:phenylacetate-CoA ligase
LRRELYLDDEAVKNLQEQRLSSLINHAYNNVAYYRRVFDAACIQPRQIRVISDLRKIPITSRVALAKHAARDITARGADINKCKNLLTSGSAGIPLNIFVNSRERRLRGLFNQMVNLENGCSIADKVLYITGERHFQKKKLCSYLGVLRESYISIYSSADEILDRIYSFRPTVIRGFVSNIMEVALKIEKVGLSGIKVSRIITTAEVLGKKEKELIARIFKAEVFNNYASNECGMMAWECRAHNGLHINSSNLILEVVDDQGNSLDEGEGNIVVTNLSLYTMPLIRYKIGDQGILTLKKCPCGRTPILLKRIIGREVELLRLPAGPANLYYPLTDLIDGFPGIEQYQLGQGPDNDITVKIIRNEAFKESDADLLLYKCSALLGGKINLHYEFVTEITKSGSGKYKTIISGICS